MPEIRLAIWLSCPMEGLNIEVKCIEQLNRGETIQS